MKIAPNSRLSALAAVAVALALIVGGGEAGAASVPPKAPAVLRPADNPLAKPGSKVPVPTIVWDTIEVRRDHPRLLFTKETLPAFRQWFAEHPINKVIGEMAKKRQDPLAMALLYQMTGDESHARGAIKKLLDGSHAHVNAYLYDWTYDVMNEAERKKATRLVARGVRVDMASGWPRCSPYTSYPEDPRPSKTPPDQWRRFYNWTFHDQDWARRYVLRFPYFARMIAVAHHAPRMEEGVRNYWEYSIKDATLFFDYLRDGSYYQGHYWTRDNRIEQIIRMLRHMKTACGVDYLDPKAHPYLANFGRWLLYCSDPTEKRMIWRYGSASMCRLPRAVLLATNSLARDPYVAWLTLQVAPKRTHWLTELLYHDKSLAPKPPDDLPRARAFPGNGLAVMRKGWGPEDPWVSLQFADWWDVHQHADSGSFIIYCKSPLAPDSGKYPPSEAAFHKANYYTRTVAHNTLTIRDPAAKRPLNDGCQRAKEERTWSFAIGRAAWVYNQDKFDRGELLAFETHDLYDYTAGSATPAYDPKLVKEFVRQGVYLRDGVFLIFDRVETTRANLEKRWLLHLVGKPKINGRMTEAEVKGHIENYDGNLVVSEGSRGAILRSHTLLPAKPRIRMVGGAIPNVPASRLVRVSRSQHRLGTGDRWAWTDPLILYYHDPITGEQRPAIAIERNSPTNVEYEVTDTEIYVKLDAYERGLVQEVRLKFADYPTLLDLVRDMNVRAWRGPGGQPSTLWHCFVHYLPGYQFYNEGLNYTPAYDSGGWRNLSVRAPEIVGKPADIGAWRVEVYPTKAATRDYFLHALRILPKAKDEHGQFSATETAERAEATVKLLGKTYVVSFNKTGKVGGHIRITDAAGKVLADADFVQKIVQKP